MAETTRSQPDQVDERFVGLARIKGVTRKDLQRWASLDDQDLLVQVLEHGRQLGLTEGRQAAEREQAQQGSDQQDAPTLRDRAAVSKFLERALGPDGLPTDAFDAEVRLGKWLGVDLKNL